MAVHQGVRVAAGHVEEHEVGGGVVQKGGEHAGHPEIHGVDRVAGSVVHQGNQRGKCAVFAGLQHGQYGGDGDEDAEEEFAHFGNRAPVEFVSGTHLFGGDDEGSNGQRHQNQVAGEVWQGIVRAEDFKAGVCGLPDAGHHYGCYHAAQEQEVPFAHELDFFGRAVGARVARQDFVGLGEVFAVEDVEHGEQHGGANQHGRQHVLHRPQEIHAFEEAEKERRIAQRGEAAADIGHEEDEENHHVHTVLAVVVGFEDGADHQHGGAGGAHHGGQERADGEQRGVHARAAVQIAPHEDAAGYGVERPQQQNEGDVFGHQGVHQHMQAGGEAVHEGEGDEEGQRPAGGDFAEMVVPNMGEKQRAGGDGEQNQHEGDAPGQAQLGAVEPAGQRGKRQGEQRQEEGGSDTHRVSF